MKSLSNKQTGIKINTGTDQYSAKYSDLLKVIVVHAPKQGGLTFADMVHRTGIKKAADKAGKTIEFENADWDYLKQIIKTMGWGFFHEDILMFCEDIDSVK